ncbi:Ig-like domain-containing protein [Verrucomicrobia bacterium]|nr:Ig-like domain-containing protein [Verrucomicrobiota bacterium]
MRRILLIACLLAGACLQGNAQASNTGFSFLHSQSSNHYTHQWVTEPHSPVQRMAGERSEMHAGSLRFFAAELPHRTEVLELNKDTVLPLQLGPALVDGLSISYRLASSPRHGYLEGLPPQVVYHPDPDFEGVEHLIYEAENGQERWVIADLEIQVGDGGFSNSDPEGTRPEISEADPLELWVDISVPGPATMDLEGGFKAIVYQWMVTPLKGAISGSGSEFSYLPFANVMGSDRMVVELIDEQGNHLLQEVLVTIIRPNRSPSFVNRSFKIGEDKTLYFNLNAMDPDQDPLIYEWLEAPLHGQIIHQEMAPEDIPYPDLRSSADSTRFFHPDSLRYLPTLDYHGSDTFRYLVHDGHAPPVEARVDFEVIPINDPPRATRVSFTTIEDQVLTLDFGLSDPESDSFELEVISPPLHGSLSIVQGQVHYQPRPNYFGGDVFELAAVDAHQGKALLPVSVQIDPLNDAPIGFSKHWQVLEDKVLELVLEAMDPDQDTLNYTVLEPPAHGRVSGLLPRVVYEPNPNYFGPDQIVFVASDGLLDSDPLVLSITVFPAPDAPQAISRDWFLSEDTSLELTLGVLDPDGFTNSGNLTFEVLELPQSGALQGSGAERRYTPDNDFHGEDRITFVVSDQKHASQPATVRLWVDAINDAPVAADMYFNTLPETPLSFQLSTTDVDSTSLKFEILQGPEKGRLTKQDIIWTYQSSVDYAHLDQFTFRVIDDQGLASEVATVRIAVEPQTNGLQAESYDLMTDEDRSLQFTVQTDFQGDVQLLDYELLKPPTHGQISLDGARFAYEPHPDFYGTDDLQYLVRGPNGLISFGSVRLSVNSVNDPPQANPLSLEVPSGAEVSFVLGGQDVDGDSLSFEILNVPLHGQLIGQAPNLVYLSDEGYFGDDSFTFQVSDTIGYNDTEQVMITVIQPELTFTTQDQQQTVREDESVNLVLQSNRYGPEVTYVVLDVPLHGTLHGEGPNWEYVPSANFHGVDRLTFEAQYEGETSFAGEVLITIIPVNDKPVAQSMQMDHLQGRELELRLLGSDVDGDSVDFQIIKAPLHGMLEGELPSLIYKPDSDYMGEDLFTYRVGDGQIFSDPAEVAITLHPEGSVPVAIGMSLDTLENQALSMVLSAEFSNPDELVYALVELPTRGTLNGQFPEFIYRPFSQQFGDDMFRFRVTAPNGMSSEATVFIRVKEVNDPPVAENLSLELNRFDQASMIFDGTDPEGQALEFEWMIQPTSLGEWTIEDRTIFFDHAGGDEEVVEASFRLYDGELYSEPATITIDILPSALDVAIEPATIRESGDDANLIVTRSSHLTKDLLLEFESSGRDRIQFASSFILPAGQEQISLPVSAIEDGIAFESLPIEMRILSHGFEPAVLTLMVEDDDVPELRLDSPVEWAIEGGQAIPLQFSLNTPIPPERVLVYFSTDAPFDIDFPKTLILSGDSMQATIEVSVPDNTISGGDAPFQLFAEAQGLSASLSMTVKDKDVSHDMRVEDGPIAGAMVFFDINGNRLREEQEPLSQTDQNGRFLMNLPVGDFDRDGDGVVNERDGQFVSQGGVDIASGLPFQGTLLAPPSAEVLTPLTTLVSRLMDQDPEISERNASEKVQEALGIAPDLDILTFDMYGELAKGNPRSLELIEPAIKIQDTLSQSGAYIQAALGETAAGAFNGLSSVLAEKINRGEALNLEDASQVASLISEATAGKGLINQQTHFLTVVETISLGNKIKNQIVEQDLNLQDVVGDLARSQALVQSALIPDLHKLVQGEITTETMDRTYGFELYEAQIAEQWIGSLSEADTRPGTFAFSKPEYRVTESGVAIEPVRIIRSEGSLGEVDLWVFPKSLTALIPNDLLAHPVRVHFENHQISAELDISGLLVDDDLEETIEVFELSLEIIDPQISQARISQTGTTVVELIDNDATGVFGFAMVEDKVEESKASTRVWMIERQGGVKGEVVLSIELLEASEGCQSGVDFELTSSQVIFADGEFEKPIPVRILEDNEVEADEFIRLGLKVQSAQSSDLEEGLLFSNIFSIIIVNDDIDMPPSIQGPELIELEEDGMVTPVVFTVNDDRTAIDQLGIRILSDNQKLIKDESITWEHDDQDGYRFIVSNLEPDANGQTRLTIEVNDGTSTTAHVIVIEVKPQNDLPLITGLPPLVEVSDDTVNVVFQVEDLETPSENLFVYFTGQIPNFLLTDIFKIDFFGKDNVLKVSRPDGLFGKHPIRIFVLDEDGLGYGQEITIDFGIDPEPVGSPVLKFQLVDSAFMEMSWEGDYQLWNAIDLKSTFELIEGATSPYRAPLNGTGFFLLRSEQIP